MLTACGGGGDDMTNGQNTSALGSPSSITLEWDSPTTTTDQTCLGDLAGYRLYVTGSGGGSLNQILPVNSLVCLPSGRATSCGEIQTCSYTVNGLTRGTWSFVATAYDNSGNESPFSNSVTYSAN